MSQEELEALLGRSLTPTEASNLTLYIDIATQSLEELICTFLEPVTETRVFDTREGYSTAFVEIFNDISEVKLNGNVTTDYSVRQWDRRSGSWFNSLVFDKKFRKDGEIEITADWGFPVSSGDDSDLPVELQMVLAGLFDLITKKNKYDGTIQSKQVEDFRISFNTDVDLDEAFYNKYAKTISKYSMCDIGNIKHGRSHCKC